MLPTALQPLSTLAHNLWWSWDSEASALWAEIDPVKWAISRHNPVALLEDVDATRLAALAAQPDFVARVDAIHERFHASQVAPAWFDAEVPVQPGQQVAYLSMEFGLHESLRIYSGGLGILAGDHLRSAADMGVPLVAVGMFYGKGYFRQLFDEYQQAEAYPENHASRLPIVLCCDGHGTPIQVPVPLGERTAMAQAYKLNVGKVRLYLLCLDHPANHAEDRALTSNLYGGDQATRIRQELLLGIGGLRLLKAVGERADLVHLNEGHCAFAVFSLVEDRLRAGDTLEQALEATRKRVVFTTHTPVPAGHDRFDLVTVTDAMAPYLSTLKLTVEQAMDLGRVTEGDVNETLCMTVVALRGAHAANGVSELHGAISRSMWQALWPALPKAEVPIGHITNGVHSTYWMHPRARTMFDAHCPSWKSRPWDEAAWAGAAGIPDAELWGLRQALRAELVTEVARRAGKRLDPEALTIGFARRFAPYKRGDLVFSEPERLEALLDQGMQLIYAGKAHPRDQKGKDLIETVLRWSADPRFRSRVVVLEDYDMVIGRALTAGTDVWLNNPRRPREASGTSGQKVILNGGLNLSVLDGWWPEGFDGTNGWEIGDGKEWPNSDDPSAQDAYDAESLYNVLTTQVLPEWQNRDADGLPTAWLERVRRSIITGAPKFSSHRMVRDYVLSLYAPALARLAASK